MPRQASTAPHGWWYQTEMSGLISRDEVDHGPGLGLRGRGAGPGSSRSSAAARRASGRGSCGSGRPPWAFLRVPRRGPVGVDACDHPELDSVEVGAAAPRAVDDPKPGALVAVDHARRRARPARPPGRRAGSRYDRPALDRVADHPRLGGGRGRSSARALDATATASAIGTPQRAPPAQRARLTPRAARRPSAAARAALARPRGSGRTARGRAGRRGRRDRRASRTGSWSRR